MKRLLSFILCIIMVLCLCSCAEAPEPEIITGTGENLNRFVLQEKIKNGRNTDSIYYDKYTGVLYIVHHNFNSGGHTVEWCTVLLGSDGLPLLADGYERETN